MKFFVKFSFIFICLSSKLAISNEYNYKFFWYAVHLAEFSIKYSKSVDEKHKVKFTLSTEGPLKIYRNYSSKVTIKRNELDYPSSWLYEIEGNDRGQPEKKIINYFLEQPPIIREFIDDKDAEPLIIDNKLDKGSSDPFSVYLNIVNNLRNNSDCEGIYAVMDGKRRYIVKVINMPVTSEEMKKYKIENGEIYYCRIELNKNDSNMKTKKKWPFNGESNYLDIWFAENIAFEALRIVVKTPLGKLKANVNQL